MTLKEYMSRSLIDKVVMMIIAVVTLISAALILFYLSVIGIPFILFIISAVLFTEVFTSASRLNKVINQMSKIGMWQEAEKEFADAKVFNKGNLRLSKTFIYRRYSHEILMYRNIQSVSLLSDDEKHNGVKVIFFNNEERVLCGTARQEAEEVISTIRKFAPRIQRI